MGAQVIPVVDEFIIGSGDILIGDDINNLESLGGASEIQGEESFEKVTMEIDNAEDVDDWIKKHQIKITGNVFQINLERFQKIRGGLDKYTAIAGTPVNDAVQTFSDGNHETDIVYILAGQNSSGAKQVIDSVILDPTGVGADITLAEGTDYVQVPINGKWGIMFRSGGAYIGAGSISVTYDYTPSAKKVLTTGGITKINPKVVMIRHKTENGKVFELTVYTAKIEGGMTFKFPADNADEAMSVPFTLVGKPDTTRPVGDQLFKIEDTRDY